MFRPTLAADRPDDDTLAEWLSEESFVASPKIDGIRCIKYDGCARTRSGLPIPNRHIQASLSHLPDGIDGELSVGDPCASDVFRRTQSEAMATHGQPVFMLHVFDNAAAPGIWHQRAQTLKALAKPHINILEQLDVESVDDLSQMTDRFMKRGFEGTVIRRTDTLYRQGKPRLKAPDLIRIKPTRRDEATVIAVEGASLTLRDLQTGVEFRCGAGLSAIDLHQAAPGLIAAYDHLPHGVKHKPRQPVFKGFRHSADM